MRSASEASQSDGSAGADLTTTQQQRAATFQQLCSDAQSKQIKEQGHCLCAQQVSCVQLPHSMNSTALIRSLSNLASHPTHSPNHPRHHLGELCVSHVFKQTISTPPRPVQCCWCVPPGACHEYYDYILHIAPPPHPTPRTHAGA